MLKISDFQELGVFEKVVRSKNGSLARVKFSVIEVNGQLRGRVLSIEPVLELRKVEGRKWRAENSNAFFLANPKAEKKIFTNVQWYEQPIISPFSSLLFFVSQPTRAPALKI